ncbi:PREDICTED: uncharacterized protein LOC103342700 [Prunus mume]|uniref:Uncharacterized protein LOC103342700 n=1 Tax=Prunus mume TaxID=102107 RepID=A0ABM0PU89_PRUMU|nr:PREDICTED: uncharacterized protein LOC103342700 [Prunus mume]
MARQGLDGTVAHSSIVLLQERFRQLQRAKEMREERELLRQMLSGSERINVPATHYEPTGLFFQSGGSGGLTDPHYKPPPQGSMYHKPNLQSKDANFLQVSDDESQVLGNICSSSVSVMNRTNNFDDSDVDTSLHL